MGNCVLKHQACLRYNFKESGSRRKSRSISHMFYISYSCLPDFFFLIKKGKMGQPKRIFTTVRINTRPMQPHKLHFSRDPSHPHVSCPVAWSVLYLESSQKPSPGDFLLPILCTVRTCFLSGGTRTDVILDSCTAACGLNRGWCVEDLGVRGNPCSTQPGSKVSNKLPCFLETIATHELLLKKSSSSDKSDKSESGAQGTC